MNKEYSMCMLYYELKEKALLLYIMSDTNRLCRLLSLRGFEYTTDKWSIVIDTSDYFDVDRFIEIVDLLGYDMYCGIECKNREEFLKDLLEWYESI